MIFIIVTMQVFEMKGIATDCLPRDRVAKSTD